MLQLISFFLHTRSFLVSYAYVSIESSNYILLSLFALNTILLTSLVNISCFSLLTLCCDVKINLLFSMNFL